jgi:hypothetical protein
MAVWVETSHDQNGNDWYPVLEEAYGNQVSRSSTTSTIPIVHNSEIWLALTDFGDP